KADSHTTYLQYPIYTKRSCSNKMIERNDDYKRSHHAFSSLSGFCAVHPPYSFVAIKWRPQKTRRIQIVESNLHGERPPFWGVGHIACGLAACRLDACWTGDTIRRAERASPGQFRSSGRRLSQRAGWFGRPGRLRADLRARPALPGLDVQLSDRHHQWRGVLAEEQRAAARAGKLLRLGRARRRRRRAAQRGR